MQKAIATQSLWKWGAHGEIDESAHYSYPTREMFRKRNIRINDEKRIHCKFS